MKMLLAFLALSSTSALVLPQRPVLTHYASQQVVHAATAEAKAANLAVTICCVDAGGVPLALARLDGAMPASADLAVGKARTAALFKRPTVGLEDGANGARAALLSAGHVLMGGGVPIVVDGYCAGAVGVSGATPAEDARVAAAGVAAVCETVAPRDGALEDAAITLEVEEAL